MVGFEFIYLFIYLFTNKSIKIYTCYHRSPVQVKIKKLKLVFEINPIPGAHLCINFPSEESVPWARLSEASEIIKIKYMLYIGDYHLIIKISTCE